MNSDIEIRDQVSQVPLQLSEQGHKHVSCVKSSEQRLQILVDPSSIAAVIAQEIIGLKLS